MGQLGRDRGFGSKGISRISSRFCRSRKAISAVWSMQGLLSAEYGASADFRVNFAAVNGLTKDESNCPVFEREQQLQDVMHRSYVASPQQRQTTWD